MEKFFTILEVNKELEQLDEKFKTIQRTKTEIAKIGEFMQKNESMNQPLQEHLSLKRKMNHAMAELYKLIAEFEDTGAVIKSVDQGLVDFPSKRFGNDVWLCWKIGETEVKFWHEKDEGFNGRKPLEMNDESLV